MLCIEYLAARCDYANEDDGVGFAKPDTIVGHGMAAQSELSDEDMPKALFLCRKYKGQLSKSAETRKAIRTLGIIKIQDHDNINSRFNNESDDLPTGKYQARSKTLIKYINVCLL